MAIFDLLFSILFVANPLVGTMRSTPMCHGLEPTG
jgi:hypothetical protein